MKLEAPECCKNPMELKVGFRLRSSDILYFQCRKCGKVEGTKDE